MNRADATAEERLNQLLDELAGSPAADLSSHIPGLEPGLARTARLVRARDDAPSADPAFADRLLGEILADAERRPKAPIQLSPRPPHRRGPEDLWSPLHSGVWSRSRWAMAQLATAALLAVTLISSFLAFGPGRHQRPAWPRAYVPAESPAPSGTEAATLVWEWRGDPAHPINNPGHLALDPAGNLWVIDGMNDQFQIFSPDGAFLERWGTSGTGNGQFALNDGVDSYGAAAFDRAGNLYVADTGNDRIQKFGPDRSFILSWGGKGHAEGQFLWPDNLAIDERGQVYVLDTDRDDIQVFDANGAYRRTIGSYGAADGHFMFFLGGGLTLDRAGNLWVADNSNQRIQEFSPEGRFLRAFGAYGLTDGKFATPNGVAVDAAGRVFVVDVSTTGVRVQIFSPQGDFLAAWSDSGGRRADLSINTSLVLDGKGNLYVADYADDRILKLRLLPPFAPAEGEQAPSVATPQPPMAELMWQATGNPAQPLDHPIALALDAAGRIWVTDTYHHQYQIFSSDGTFLETWGTFGTGPGQFNFQKSVNGVSLAGHTA